jgi:hypothetical protein
MERIEKTIEGAAEHVGDATGAMNCRVQSSVESLEKFIEDRGRQTGAWRGEVHDGQPQSTPGRTVADQED